MVCALDRIFPNRCREAASRPPRLKRLEPGLRALQASSFLRVEFVCLFFSCAAAITAHAQEWTRFRGPNGSGISPAKTIPTFLAQSNLNWKVEVPGSGHSSPVLWGTRLFITATDNSAGGLSALCIDSASGRTLWKHEFPLKPFSHHAYNSFASATPAVDASRAYFVWNEPDHYFLVALDHSGKVVWQRDFGPFISQHGSGSSPIVYGGKVILANFQDDPTLIEGPKPDSRTGKSSVIAVDVETGKTIWETARRSTVVSYSTPCIYQQSNGAKALICNSQSHGISALDPATGKVLWEYARAFDKRSVSSPVIDGPIIFGSCGSGGGGNFITAIDASAVGGSKNPTLAFQIKKAAAYVPTPVGKDGLAWIWSDAGILTCINSKTGEIKYQERVGGNYFGSPVWIDHRLFCVSKTGETVIAAATDKFDVLHRFALNEICESTPAVANENLFIRTEKHLWCFGSAASKQSTALP
jgi:outer membrane protein assembly factor BamB